MANNNPMYDRILRDAQNRTEKGLNRTCAQPLADNIIDLSSNSYCNLHDNKIVQTKATELCNNHLNGNGASRLVGTASPLFEQLEQMLAAWSNTEAALVFTTGYAANVGVIQALCNRDTTVFSDRLNHASIVDGIVLSRAEMVRYSHCDLSDLRNRLAASSPKEKLIITESVFSMDGDCAPLSDICQLAQEYNCMVMVDEAHATGLFGKTGSGLIEAHGVTNAVDIHLGTLSKTIAGLGGFVACSQLMRDHLVNHARSFIYSTALPHAVLAWDCAAVDYLRSNPEVGASLSDKARIFREELKACGFSTGTSSTQIIPCIIGGNNKTVALMKHLMERGICAPAIRSPTVPQGSERIRLSLHMGISSDQLHHVVDVLREWKKNNE